MIFGRSCAIGDKRLEVRDDPDLYDPDTGIFQRNFYHSEIGAIARILQDHLSW